MKKKQIIIIMLIILSFLTGFCSRRYYSNHPGKVTKGYNKPPKDLKR